MTGFSSNSCVGLSSVGSPKSTSQTLVAFRLKMAKFVPVGVTVHPEGKGLPGEVWIDVSISSPPLDITLNSLPQHIVLKNLNDTTYCG
jgi:hypothetical protein